LFAGGGIQDRYHAPVEIYSHDLVMEEGANGPDSKRLVKKSLIEKGTVYRIDALFKNKVIQGRGTKAAQGCEHEDASKEWEYAAYLSILIIGLTL
jgi:hypothetical protein